jgi:hypothetical protein
MITEFQCVLFLLDKKWTCLDTLTGLEIELVSNFNFIPKQTLSLEVFGSKS